MRLTDAERKMIAEKYPEIYDKYYGEKYGRVDFYWELSSKKVLQLTARGYLLKKKLNWYVQIKNMFNRLREDGSLKCFCIADILMRSFASLPWMK